MKLFEIAPLFERNISAELQQAKDEYTEFRRKHTQAGGGIKHEALAQGKRFQAKIRSLNDEIKNMANAPSDEERKETKNFIQQVDNRKDDKKATEKRLSKAQSEGNMAANAWIKKHDGYSGAAKELERIAKEQTNNGQEPFDAQVVADKIGITKGSVLRWINSRKEFSGMKKYMKK